MSEKVKTLESFLEHQYCLLHINPAVPGTKLPEHLAKELTVTLKVSQYFSGYVSVTEESVVTRLTFGPTVFECVIPLKALWGTTSDLGDVVIWEEDAPHPMLVAMLRETAPKAVEEPKPKKASSDLKLTSEGSKSFQKSEKRERPSFLKRVK